MKTAYELAMERLSKAAPGVKLSDDQKKQLAELDSHRFTEEAAEMLVNEALEKGQSVREVCGHRFKDFQFGLKLIAQSSSQREFVIDKDVVAAPDKALSDWVVASYRGGAKPESP